MVRNLVASLLILLLGSAIVVGPTATPTFAADHETAAAEHGDAGGSGQPNILELKPSLAISTLVVFFALLTILRTYAWKPLMDALHDREHHLTHTLEETERARSDAERLLAEHKAELAKASDQVKAMLDDARGKAQALKDDLIRQAQEEAEAARKRAEREIGSAKDQALLELWNTSAEMAVSVAGKVLPRELSDNDHRRLVEQALGELPASPAKANGQGARS